MTHISPVTKPRHKKSLVPGECDKNNKPLLECWWLQTRQVKGTNFTLGTTARNFIDFSQCNHLLVGNIASCLLFYAEISSQCSLCPGRSMVWFKGTLLTSWTNALRMVKRKRFPLFPPYKSEFPRLHDWANWLWIPPKGHLEHTVVSCNRYPWSQETTSPFNYTFFWLLFLRPCHF